MLPQEGKQRQLHDTIFWEHNGNHAIRQGDWKLVSKFPEPWELYNLAENRTEMKEIGAKQPARVKDMRGLYDAWAKRCNVVPWDEVENGASRLECQTRGDRNLRLLLAGERTSSLAAHPGRPSQIIR